MSSADRKFIVEKIIEFILTIFIVTIMSFILMRISPIDSATAYARRNAFAITADTKDSLSS